MDRSDRSDESDRSVLHIRLITPLRLITLDSHPAEACLFASVWVKIKLRIASILSDANLTKISYTAKPSPKNQKKPIIKLLGNVFWEPEAFPFRLDNPRCVAREPLVGSFPFSRGLNERSE